MRYDSDFVDVHQRGTLLSTTADVVVSPGDTWWFDGLSGLVKGNELAK